MTANAMEGDREACLAAGHGRLHRQAHPPRDAERGAHRGRGTGRGRHEPSPSGGGGHVLVVDDAAFNRRLLARLLAGLGHTTRRGERTVPGGPGHPARCERRPDAAVRSTSSCSTSSCPCMDGYETLAALKADDEPCAICRSSSSPMSTSSTASSAASGWARPTTCPSPSRRRSCAPGSRRRSPRSACTTSSARPWPSRPGSSPRSIASARSSRASSRPQVAALVSSDDGEALLAGHRREITAMFCDLRNFTVFSEAAEPEEVLGFLRAYHAAMGHADRRPHEGTLEHFAGDGFMTFFNDPILQPDHADPGGPPGRRDARPLRGPLGGLATSAATCSRSGSASRPGYATLGRIGFEGRYDYGAVGHVIIHAARLSGDAAPGEILIAQRTFAAGRGFDRATPAGERQLKGFSRPVVTYAVMGDRRHQPGGDRHVTGPALDMAAFERLLDITGGDLEFLDELVDTYLERRGCSARDAPAARSPTTIRPPSCARRTRSSRAAPMSARWSSPTSAAISRRTPDRRRSRTGAAGRGLRGDVRGRRGRTLLERASGGRLGSVVQRAAATSRRRAGQVRVTGASAQIGGRLGPSSS